MKTLYLECAMGAAGDMLMAALSEVLPHAEAEAFMAQMNALGLPGVQLERLAVQSGGMAGTRMRVTIAGAAEEEHHDHGHDHSHDCGHDHIHAAAHRHAQLVDIVGLIRALPVSARVKADAEAVYGLIAEAEAAAHGQPVELVHFHEVGALDAVADVVGVCLLMEQLAPARIVVSPVHVGCGTVRCAHGELPVPAPATALLLRDVPMYGGAVRGELCTPTGAALLRHFADAFGPMPCMRISAIGCGIGTRDFGRFNGLRAFLGETEDAEAAVAELCCNVDDMTGEALSFAMQALFDAGALDVFVTPILMKKGRPGQLLSCLCEEAQAEKIAVSMLKHTSTFGVRRYACTRYTLQRETDTVQTPCGALRVKSGRGYGVEKKKAEYEDAAKLAREKNIPLAAVLSGLEK